jgi:molecular chaperone HscB
VTSCWNCQAQTDGALFCPSCGKIAPAPRGETFFDVFGLPASPKLDEKALEERFRELSLKLHPDRFAQAAPKERLLSLERTTTLNDAYRTLKDPTRRAFYLLKLQGIDLDREDAGAQTAMPLPFLEEVMALREALDALEEKKDLDGAQKMAEDVAKRQKAALAAAFDALEQKDAKKASHELAQVRYFARFLEEVEAMEEEALG